MVSLTVFKLGSAVFLGLLTIVGGTPRIQRTPTTWRLSPVHSSLLSLLTLCAVCTLRRSAVLPLRLTSVSEQKRVG